MSKISFRGRALDASKPMSVYKAEEIPDLPDFTAINRAVPQMPTGMEKEEESEHHLQRALSAQQVYGTAESLVIPIPELDRAIDYDTVYRPPGGVYKAPKPYIHVQPWGMDQEIPDYDMDSEDEAWLNKQSKKLEGATPLKFETMIDRLEKGSGRAVVQLQEAKALLREDDDLTIAVYDYWLNKRLRLEHTLIPQVKTEKRDGSTTNNPYVAFRRRTEKMQTRKNRKNDETSYEKMLKIRRDLNKALTILELMKRREKSKKELLKLTIEIVEKRYQVKDWDGVQLAEALAKRHTLPPTYIPIHVNRDWGTRDDVGYTSKKTKREYKKRKHKPPQVSSSIPQQPSVVSQLPQYTEVDNLNQPDTFSSEEDSPQHMSASDHEADDDPDGVYAFKRKEGCSYHAPINDGLGNWPWHGQEEGGFGHSNYRYSLTSLSEPRQCVGYSRRRVGRGGRVLLDRGISDMDDIFSDYEFNNSNTPTSTHIKEKKIPHFRPRTPTEESLHHRLGRGDCMSPSFSHEFNAETFQNHQEQLLQMQRQQEQQLLRKQETVALSSSTLDICSSSNSPSLISQQPTTSSRFTLDSASAQFAASAVCNSASELIQITSSVSSSSTIQPAVCKSLGSSQTSVTSMIGAISSSSGTLSAGQASNASSITSCVLPASSSQTNGPLDSKSNVFSTSPAANVLQLNYPISSVDSGTSSMNSTASASTNTSSVAPSTVVNIPIGSSTVLGPATATKCVTPTNSTVLKIASTPSSKNETIITENHQGAASILLKDKVVAMEVT